ncbi:GntR family transcriptional regulator [Conyzicola nivalis]|uniref:GntR family transcriptional regulator n=1 Tax=Conyzicola nivalis TaxID=1477021 RepID=A0A916WL05_9MICO|nr:GntR family transcriptional regulator [Conyzicola nivalis]GGB07911.1 GntR family transcriptional regulator [Conyzicola nivalis]
MTTDATSAVLPDAIYSGLRSAIISQSIAPGDSVTESAIALRFGVARPTAKTAIERLVADGLLRREKHQTARVPRLSRADILDLFDSRAVVESAAVAALATGGPLPAEALSAHRALLATATSDTADGDFATHDIDFHRALVAGQPSLRLARMHALLMGEIELCIGQVQAAHLLTAAEVGAQHQGILDAVTAGDADRAARLTREHIAGARDRLLTHFDTDPL